tara:strand:+ start:26700 stop:27263 length:564 start_codon:yes stop_codon:yes gene_type:complete
MSPAGVFRPTFQNRRLGGTRNKSPGNGGVIGPIRGPKGEATTLGCRCFDPFNKGVFRLSEQFCGVQNGCNGATIDCCGFLFCITSTKRWFVVPYDAQVSRNFYGQSDATTKAQQSYGDLGWFYGNPSFAWACRQYFDAYNNSRYWNQGQESNDRAQSFSYTNGQQCTGHNNNKWNGYYQRAFRCVDI